jgi:hypothetical protein
MRDSDMTVTIVRMIEDDFGAYPEDDDLSFFRRRPDHV